MEYIVHGCKIWLRYVVCRQRWSYSNHEQNVSKDPKHKNRLINILKKSKVNGSISDELYWNLYPYSEEPTELYGTHKIHKSNTPFRPIVSSGGSVTYNAAKYLAASSGQELSQHQDTILLVDKQRRLEIPPAQKLVLYDVTALFTHQCPCG